MYQLVLQLQVPTIISSFKWVLVITEEVVDLSECFSVEFLDFQFEKAFKGLTGFETYSLAAHCVNSFCLLDERSKFRVDL